MPRMVTVRQEAEHFFIMRCKLKASHDKKIIKVMNESNRNAGIDTLDNVVIW